MDMALLFFFLGLAIIASICHGVWVLGTFFFHFFSSNGFSSKESLVQSEKETDQDRLTAQRYIRRLYYEGKIPEQDFATLIKYTTEDLTSSATDTDSALQPDEKPSVPQPASTAPKKQTPLQTEPEPTEAASEISDFLDETDFLDEPTTPQSLPPVSHKSKNRLDHPEKTTPKKRPLGSLLNAFMEEKNIRWGELISGLLIVGSAIGLVISLWSTLKNQIPYLPALLFLMATAAIHGAGLYTQTLETGIDEPRPVNDHRPVGTT